MKLQPKSNNQASALIIAIMMVVVIATMVGLGTLFNSSIMRNTHRSQAILQASAIADGSLEAMYAQWRTVASDTPRNAALTPLMVDGLDPVPLDEVEQAYVQLIKPAMMPTEEGLAYVPMDAGVEPDRAMLPGRMTVPQYRAFTRVSLPTTFGTLEMDVSQIFRYEGESPTRWAVLEIIEPWNENGRIVGGELEIHPGPSMEVDDTHTNGMLYTAHRSLSFIGRSTFGKNWKIAYSPNDTTRGSARPSNPKFINDLPPVSGERVSFFNIDPQNLELGIAAKDRDDNPNNDGFREMLKKADPNFPDPLNPPGRDSVRPYDQTPVRIAVNSTTGALNVFDINGNARPPSDPLYRTIAKAIDPTLNVSNIGSNFTLPPTAFTDMRDNRISSTNNTKITNLNVAVLAAALEGGLTVNGNVVVPDLSDYNFGPPNEDLRSLDNGWNGAIYIEDVTSTPKDATEFEANKSGPKNYRGIRLTQGGRLPKVTRPDGSYVGLSVVTPNPAYILGDFNTGTTYEPGPGGNPFTNKDPVPKKDNAMPRTSRSPSGGTSNFDGNNRAGTGYAHPDSPSNSPIIPPAAIMADAVTILSNAWKDANHTNGLSGKNGRIATHTTVNTAIISGTVPSGATDYDGSRAGYSGGAENFPRFLEKWNSGTTFFTYHGSMIMAYRSEQAYFRWGKGNVYAAPTRRWFHEANFRTVTLNGMPINNPPPLLPRTVFSYPRTPKVIERIAFN